MKRYVDKPFCTYSVFSARGAGLEVCCPYCGKMGIVSIDNDNGYYQCATCGKNANKALPAWIHWYRANDGKYINRIRDGIEPFFGYPLFYQTGFSGKLIWAINREHLVYMIDYLEANLREKSGYRCRMQSSVLPKFMKLAKNRARVVKVLCRLLS